MTRGLTVLQVAPYRLSGESGLVTMIRRLGEGLGAHGHRSLILVAGDSDGVMPVPDRPGTFEIYLRQALVAGARVRALAGFVAYLPVSLASLARFIRRERVDVVHVHFPTPLSLYLAALRPLATWRLVTTFHGTDAYALARRSRLHRALLGRVLARADLVTAVSADLLRAVERAFPRLRAPRRVIPNGNPAPVVNGRPAAAPAGLPRRYMLAVGSLIPRKGYDVLLRAVRLGRDQGCRLPLVIAGRGPEAERLAALARDLSVEDQVVFAGEIGRDDVLGLYDHAEFFVHAAREESSGLVLLEAMSRRKAVIAPGVNGIPEAVRHEETGLLVEPESPPSLAAAIARLERDERLREALGTRGREFVARERTWDGCVEGYVAAYAAVTRRA